jgi:hypothetical protein
MPKKIVPLLFLIQAQISLLGQGWSVVKRYNHLHTVEGEALRLVDAVARVADPLQPKKSLGIITVCRALYKPNAQESLIPPAQLSWYGLAVCTKPLLNGGQPSIYSAKGSIAHFFYGKLTWFLHQKPTDKELNGPAFQLTSSDKYEPEKLGMDALDQAQSNGETASSPGEDDFEFDYSLEDDLVPTHRTKRIKFIWDASSH